MLDAEKERDAGGTFEEMEEDTQRTCRKWRGKKREGERMGLSSE